MQLLLSDSVPPRRNPGRSGEGALSLLCSAVDSMVLDAGDAAAYKAEEEMSLAQRDLISFPGPQSRHTGKRQAVLTTLYFQLVSYICHPGTYRKP